MSIDVWDLMTILVRPCRSMKGVVSSDTIGSVTGMAPMRSRPTSPSRISLNSCFKES